MGRKKSAEGEVNKSQAIRDLLKEQPKLSGKDAIAALAEKGVTVTGSLFYLVKGKALGRKKQRKVRERQAVGVVESAKVSHRDAIATIRKVKGLAAELGGLDALKELLDALSE